MDSMICVHYGMQFRVPAQTSAIITNGEVLLPVHPACLKHAEIVPHARPLIRIGKAPSVQKTLSAALRNSALLLNLHIVHPAPSLCSILSLKSDPESSICHGACGS